MFAQAAQLVNLMRKTSPVPGRKQPLHLQKPLLFNMELQFPAQQKASLIDRGSAPMAPKPEKKLPAAAEKGPAGVKAENEKAPAAAEETSKCNTETSPLPAEKPRPALRNAFINDMFEKMA
jgi:hypothetical protein